MFMSRARLLAVPALLLFAFHLTAGAAETPAGANSEPAYQQLRHIQAGAEAYDVKDLRIVRDIGVFHLKSGVLCLLPPVNGMVTGAMFRGEGSFSMRSDDPREQNHMRVLTKQDGIEDDFEKLVLRFADDTPAELKAVMMTAPPHGGCPADLLEDSQRFLHQEMKFNLAARLLQPVLAGKPDGFFFAVLQGKRYGRLGFVVDPVGTWELAPEEVCLLAFSDSKFGVWYGGHLLSEPRDGWRVRQPAHDSGVVRPLSHKIDATIERSGHLSATTTVTFASKLDGLWVVPFHLMTKLRVSAVKDGEGTPLAWIQEKEDEDGDYYAVLAKPAARGEQLSVTTTYAGKEAVLHTGDGNYYPAARENWYPNLGQIFRDFASYEMTLRVPKGTVVAATGTQLSQHNEGAQSVTEWKSEGVISVAGFSLGDFKTESARLEAEGVQVTAYVNREPPDFLKGMQHANDFQTFREQNSNTLPLGTFTTTPMLKRSLAEGATAIQLYTNYFGPMSAKSLLITQQTEGGFGQAWPGLLYLPVYYFLDNTQRNALGLTDLKEQYWTVVEPHETAHQWWGNTIGWKSYRDQWMSEGFADFSAALFIEFIRHDRGAYVHFWKELRERLVQKDEWGHRPIDVGSVTMGLRVSTAKVGERTAESALYAKGAYILHMLRQMMFDPRTGDTDFKAMMHDLVESHRNQAVSTEDFKAVVEKHMKPQMDAGGNGRMDWFFDEWVDGTEIPSYASENSVEKSADGKGGTVTLKVTQSGVSSRFRMVVPVYYELPDGKVGRLGQLRLTGNESQTQKVPFGSIQPKRLFINYNDDVLSAN